MKNRSDLYAGSIVGLDLGNSSVNGLPVVQLSITLPGGAGGRKAINVSTNKAHVLADDLRAAALAIRKEMAEGARPSPGSYHGVEALLHIGDGLGGEFHVDLWIEQLRKSGVSLLVVARSVWVLMSLKKRADIDVVYVKDGRDAECLVEQCPDLKAVFYTSNTGNVVHFIRVNELQHIFLGHGDSDKSASCHKFFRVYDEVWVAGRAHRDRFIESGVSFASTSLRVVGRPQIRGSLGTPVPVSADAPFLYLPTWEGFYVEQNYSSVLLGPSLMAAVSSSTGRTPKVKFHPWTGKQLKSEGYTEDAFAIAYQTDARPLEMVERFLLANDIMAGSAFLISDISSVITDYLPTQRPIFMFRPRNVVFRTASSRVPLEDYVYIFADEEQLLKLIDRVIVEGDDYLEPARRRALDYFIDVDATKRDAIVEEVLRVVGRSASFDTAKTQSVKVAS